MHKVIQKLGCLLLVCGSAHAASPPKNAPDRNITGFEAADETQPLWEFGVGGGVGEVPNYPASSERNFIALAAPYIIYRGDVFRLGGGGGARAVVAEDDRWELDISVGGAFAADTDENSARAGMPELDYLLELGPQVVYLVHQTRNNQGATGRLNLRLQARSVISTDFRSFEHQGYLFEPELQWQQRGYWGENTAMTVRLSSTFASEDLHDYFYQVDAAFVTDIRPEYDARSGYLGSELSVAFSFQLSDNIRAFLGGTVRNHSGAANENSPLFERDTTYSLAAGFVWRIHQSEAKASF
ncbi:MipA/OmpV family protein [Alteromonas sediminis]|nr:MipA/OmpV family protein [Alteromonas sediminis]